MVQNGTDVVKCTSIRMLRLRRQLTELTANGGESADNTTGNIVLTKNTAP